MMLLLFLKDVPDRDAFSKQFCYPALINDMVQVLEDWENTT